MKESIYKIKDKEGNDLGLLKTEDFLDIIDVVHRAKIKYGDDIQHPIYIGDVSE